MSEKGIVNFLFVLQLGELEFYVGNSNDNTGSAKIDRLDGIKGNVDNLATFFIGESSNGNSKAALANEENCAKNCNQNQCCANDQNEVNQISVVEGIIIESLAFFTTSRSGKEFNSNFCVSCGNCENCSDNKEPRPIFLFINTLC